MQNSLEAPVHEEHASAVWKGYRWGCDNIIACGAALQFLTVLPPLLRRPLTAAELGRAVGYFPLIGVGLGGILLGVHSMALALWPAGLAGAVVLASWAILSGGLHLDGFLDSCDGLLGGHTAEDRLRILRDHHVGAYAVIGGIVLLLLKYQALLAVADRAGALLLAPALGRWAMALAITFFPYARPQGLGRAMKNWAGWPQVALASATVAFVLCGCWSLVGLLALGLAALTTLLVARFTLARLPGFTGDVYGALCEVVEVVTLLTLAAGGAP